MSEKFAERLWASAELKNLCLPRGRGAIYYYLRDEFVSDNLVKYCVNDYDILILIYTMGFEDLQKFLMPHLWRQDEPEAHAPLKYDPNFGFDERKKISKLSH